MIETMHVLQRSLPAAIALGLLLTPADPGACLIAAPAAAREPGSSPAEETRIDRASAVIERAFLRGEADLLAPALSRRVKIFLAVPSLDVVDGYYGADQVIVLLRRVFADRSTVRFAPLPAAPRLRPGGQVVLVARWSARDASSVETEHRLAFLLAPEGDALTVREIRELK